MTKEVFAGFFKKAIPGAGGVFGGSITYLSFKPCCERLKSSLMDTKLSNSLYVESREEIEIFNAIVTDANEVCKVQVTFSIKVTHRENCYDLQTDP